MKRVQQGSSSLRSALRDIRHRTGLFEKATRVKLRVSDEADSGAGKVRYGVAAIGDDPFPRALQEQLEQGSISLYRGGTNWESARELTCEVEASDSGYFVLGKEGLEKDEFRLRELPSSQAPRRALFRLQDAPVESDIPLLRLFLEPDEADWPSFTKDSGDVEWTVLKDLDRDGCAQQREFVRLLLASPDFSLMNGPPGSGKTTVIMEAIVQAVRDGRRVLLCAPTHVAVDNVLERLDASGLMDREGILPVRIESGRYKADLTKRFTESEMASSFRASVSSHLESLSREEWSAAQRALLELATADPQRLNEMLMNASNLVCGTTVGVNRHSFFDDQGDRPQREQFDHLIIDEASKVTLPEMLVPAIRATHWSLIGDVRQLSPVGAGDVDAVLAGAVSEAVRSLPGDEIEVLAVLAARVDVVKAGRVGHRSRRKGSRIELVGSEGVRASVTSAYEAALEDSGLSTVDPILGHDPLLSRDLRELTIETTVDSWAAEMGWRLELLHGLRQVPEGDSDRNRLETEVEILANTGISELDEEIERARQLVTGVCLASVLESLQLGLGRSRRHRASVISDGLPEKTLAARQVSLTFQHRMHPEISCFPREHFYEGSHLMDAGDLEARSWPIKRYGSRSVWISVRSGDDGSTERVVLDELNDLISDPSCPPDLDVGIISPYAKQVRELRKVIGTHLSQSGTEEVFKFHRANVRIETVDRFQGREADVIFLVVGAASETPFTKSPNRMNVALTRARHQLVVFGDHAALSSKGSGSLFALTGSLPVEHRF